MFQAQAKFAKYKKCQIRSGCMHDKHLHKKGCQIWYTVGIPNEHKKISSTKINSQTEDKIEMYNIENTAKKIVLCDGSLNLAKR